MKREEMLELILEQAGAVIAIGEEHIPMLVGIDDDDEVSIFAFPNLENKQAVADICKRLVEKHKLYMAAWICESWVTEAENDEQCVKIQKEGVETQPNRQEALMISIQDIHADITWIVPIESGNSQRRLAVEAKIKLPEEGSDNRWKLFTPVLN